MSPCCDFGLENSKHIFLHALQLMMMHHNTKFGNKMLGGLEDTIWTNTDILTLHCDLDLKCSYPFFSQKILAYDDVSSDQVWLPKNQQFRRYCPKKLYFHHMSPHSDLDLEYSQFFLLDILVHNAAPPYQVL